MPKLSQYFWPMLFAIVCSTGQVGLCEQLDDELSTPQSDEAASIAFFEKKIRPVLVEHCYQCHAADAKQVHGGLLVDSREAIRTGGESGSGIVPNDPDESLVLDALRHETFEMPPSGKLPDNVIADFERWILDGAADPRESTATVRPKANIDIDAGREFWCFRPLQDASLPEVKDQSWPESDIDTFILSKLEQQEVQPVADANRSTLIRRVQLALTGLPPTPEEILEFLNDPSPTNLALTRLVDRLLESQHFGERWGRHWLDVVRFAESSGGGRTLLFPDAWRYRDYVIEAFNADMPYDQFVREQIAGDLLPADDWQTRRRQLTATAFLLLGPTNYELQDKEILEMDIVDEQLDTIGKALMGMTIGCARCHDHKFDPIPMQDYYAMAGIFKSTRSVVHANVSAWNTVKLPADAATEAAIAQSEAELKAKEQQLKRLKKKVTNDDAIAPDLLPGIVVDDEAATKSGNWKKSVSVKPYVGNGYIHDNGARDATATVDFRCELQTPGDYEVRVAYTHGGNRSAGVPVVIHHADGITKKTINQQSKPRIGAFDSLGTFPFEGDARVVISNDGAEKGVVIADAVQLIPVGKSNEQLIAAKAKSGENDNSNIRQQIADLEQQIKTLKAKAPKRETAMAPVEEDSASDIHLAIRGVPHNKGPLVSRGVLQVALSRPFPEIPPKASGRLEFANWLVDASHPLTARLMVNRVWYWLFGEGLVRTVDNFGETGDTPSHPELLDHLALEFMQDGWSIKRLVRRIVLSHVYRLDSDIDHAAYDVDSANRLLWRMNRRRLEAEVIRDSLLQFAGTLDRQMGGPNIKADTKIEYDYVFDSPRRSVYLPVFRNTLPQVFATFDFADPNIQGGKRTASTIAPQALLLMNQPFVINQMRLAAERLLADETIEPEERVDYCYLQVLGREPSPRERMLAERFLGPTPTKQDFSLFYQTLIQSLDFRYAK